MGTIAHHRAQARHSLHRARDAIPPPPAALPICLTGSASPRNAGAPDAARGRSTTQSAA